MERSTVTFFLFLIITGAAIGDPLEKMVGNLGNSLSVPCPSIVGNETLSVVSWLKDGGVVASRNLSVVLTPSDDKRLSITKEGSLNIAGLLLIDEGIYICNYSSLDHKTETQMGIQLLIAGGPTNVRTEVTPVAALPNGTLFVQKDSAVSFNCSSNSYPSQTLSWVFQDLESNSSVLASSNKSPLELHVSSIQSSNQGTYSCIAQNTLSNQTASKSTLLLVYYAPDRHPECSWVMGNDSSHLLLNCSWHGSYPLPTLQWEEVLGADRSKPPVLNVSMTTESLVVTLNRSELYDGQTLQCTGQNQMLRSQPRFCSVTLKAPLPKGVTLLTALEGGNATLTCNEANSTPVAKTSWRRRTSNSQIQEVVPSAKYIVSDLGPEFTLKIVNISKFDEGVYLCRSENTLMVKELEFLLTVESSVSYAGGVVGVFIAILIIGVGIAVGVSAYRNRDRICLGTGFGFMEEERHDVFHLVESDDEEIFSEPVTRSIATAANGHATSIVQIHRIPSSDHEDLGTTDTEVEETSKPPEQELVTF